MLSKISQTNTACYHLYVESKTEKKKNKKKVKLIETESKKVVARGWGSGQGNRERLVNWYKL